MDELEAKAAALLARAPGGARARFVRLEHLAGDGSARRYWRVRLAGGDRPTAILMLLAHERGPLSRGGEGLTQDDTFVELASFLAGQRIPVPRVLVDGRPEGCLLVEDVGDLALWRFAFGRLGADGERLRADLGSDATQELFARATDVIRSLQGCEARSCCVAFQRWLGPEEYLAEARRFVEHYLAPRGLCRGTLPLVERSLEELCSSVAAHPRALMHRDFMPWNLHVLPDGQVAVIDFQDALLGSYAYDLVSLLHDRDVDEALGRDLCADVVRGFAVRMGHGRAFRRHYQEALLQRYLRLAGQFHLLTLKTGRPCYEAWVPGCLRRVGRTMAAMPGYEALLAVLAAELPEVRDGAREPWDPWA